jgi:hypothetical protein
MVAIDQFLEELCPLNELSVFRIFFSMLTDMGSRRVWSINRGCLLLLGTWSHLRYIGGSVLTHLFLWFVFPTCILRRITLWYLSHFIHLIFGTLLCHTKIQIKFEFGFDTLIFSEVTALALRKISWIIRFQDFFFSLLTNIHLIFGSLLCHTKIQVEFEFHFDPLEFYEVMAHRLRKILRIVSFLHFCTSPMALQSQVVTNQNLVWLCLNYFEWIYHR